MRWIDTDGLRLSKGTQRAGDGLGNVFGVPKLGIIDNQCVHISSLLMRITLALLCCSWSYDLLRLDSGVVETIAALNQVFQPLGEACCRSAVHHPTIKADRLLPSSCPSASLTDLSRRKFT